MSYKKYWNSTNEKSYEPYPEWDVGFNELLGHCFNPERDEHWYLIAYHNLSIYHIKLKQKTTVKIHLLKGIMETLINCMVNKKNNSLMYKDNDFNRIVLRRCCAEGLCINFHLDHSLKTMQIALNDDNEYVGGRLVFATNDGVLYEPRRPAGSVTIHNNTVVHGVSTLRSGVRYGLFFLKTLPES